MIRNHAWESRSSGSVSTRILVWKRRAETFMKVRRQGQALQTV